MLPRQVRGPIACALLLPFLVATLTLPVQIGRYQVGVAWAQADDKPVLGVIPFARRGSAGVLQAARIEEDLRQMLDAGGSVRLLPSKVIDSGKPLAPLAKDADAKSAKEQTAAGKALDKADKLAITARTMFEEGEDAGDVLKLLVAAAQRYEDNFQELVDFTKLVDVYSQAATASLAQQKEKEAREWVIKALVIQPTFVVDARKSNKELQKLVTAERLDLDDRPKTTLTVECVHKDADVFVDGVKVGNPPATASELAPGTHYVQVRKAGALPWGQKLVAAKGKPVNLRPTLVMEPSTEGQIGLEIAPDDIKAYAATGTFHDKLFKNEAAAFAKQIKASHLLYGVVSTTARTLDVHLFVYSAKLKKTCAVDALGYQPNLTDLQMKTLEAEGRVRALLNGCSAMKEVAALPAVYTGAAGSGAAGGGAAGSSTDGDDAGNAPAVVPADSDAESAPPAKPEPKIFDQRPKPEPKPEPKAAATADAGSADDFAGLLNKEAEAPKAWYQQWWLWTGAAVLVGGGITAAVLLSRTSGNTSASGFTAQVVLP
jgi:hypothetical protein